MKITNDGIVSTQTTAKAQPAASAPAVRDLAAPGVSKEDVMYAPSPDWLCLLEQVRQEPEVREDVVQAAIARLGRGEYATPQSAANTAAAILNSND